MATISTEGIASGSLIYPEHVLRSIDALNGATPYDITLSGSLTISGSTGNTGLKISSGSVLPNPDPNAYVAYNTSSGDIYFTTASLTFPIVKIKQWDTLPGSGVQVGTLAVTGSALAYHDGNTWVRILTGSL
jgi:hypothetical protein